MLLRLRRLPLLLLIGVNLGSAFAHGQVTSDQALRQRFAGAWRLVSIETARPNGEVIYPFYGRRPEGILIYDRNGWMSVQIISDPRPALPTADSREGFLAVSAAEKSKAADGYYGYYGTWVVSAEKQTVTHHIKNSFYPGEREEEGVRHFMLTGDTLILTARTHEMGEDHERKLVWQRVPEAQP
jgi:Lipocalin-like domain